MIHLDHLDTLIEVLPVTFLKKRIQHHSEPIQDCQQETKYNKLNLFIYVNYYSHLFAEFKNVQT